MFRVNLSATRFTNLAQLCDRGELCKVLTNLNQRSKSTTIYALATAIKDKGSPIAVIRVSGSSALKTLQILTRNDSIVKPRQCSVKKLYDPSNAKLLDIAMTVFYAEPKSYTGEDMCEYFVHGSRAVISQLMTTLGSLKDMRLAEPGEFTKRAFLNKKMDLTAAEAVMDLVEAQTDSQRQRALDGLSGHTKQLYASWRQRLLRAAAHFEANIDFGEDELLDEETLVVATQSLQDIKLEIESYLSEASRRSELIKNGLQIAIVGPPNAGKSSLINLLCKRDISIVSPIMGTTRDVVESILDINGYIVKICDTAGLRNSLVDEESVDQIEKEGIKRALAKVQTSDLVLYMVDATEVSSTSDIQKTISKLNKESQTNFVVVINKKDLLEANSNNFDNVPSHFHFISCKTSEGIDSLLGNIENHVTSLCESESRDYKAFLTERHRVHLSNMCLAIDQSATYIKTDLAISTHYVREAINECASLTGHVSNDDILDIIFKDFCIGK